MEVFKREVEGERGCVCECTRVWVCENGCVFVYLCPSVEDL